MLFIISLFWEDDISKELWTDMHKTRSNGTSPMKMEYINKHWKPIQLTAQVEYSIANVYTRKVSDFEGILMCNSPLYTVNTSG